MSVWHSDGRHQTVGRLGKQSEDNWCQTAFLPNALRLPRDNPADFAKAIGDFNDSALLKHESTYEKVKHMKSKNNKNCLPGASGGLLFKRGPF